LWGSPETFGFPQFFRGHVIQKMLFPLVFSFSIPPKRSIQKRVFASLEIIHALAHVEPDPRRLQAGANKKFQKIFQADANHSSSTHPLVIAKCDGALKNSFHMLSIC
jgi:hypothetical protein